MPIERCIDGIEHYGKRIKVRAYVDDLVVFVSSMKDVRRACDIILEFCAWTNARECDMNVSTCIILGSAKKTPIPIPMD
ncbi:hypothetical protein DAPPUDRAFT_331269 [Daphnia pulex]|uniref:Reverse transcriptase domain-containing protein n=1 Tax=Daphnia pulex TaxID=6669 RepID=E9HLY9_DAPPU|nr:hypothetical protein DAPPUDRAFT_331269 [Daphnia pulex]|eukprot:EFX67221.1 hypothetical protein DAPPUDRAFT_331269 [Daphnia pulex]